MEKDIIVRLHKDFEQSIYKDEETGLEFWLARELQKRPSGTGPGAKQPVFCSNTGEWDKRPAGCRRYGGRCRRRMSGKMKRIPSVLGEKSWTVEKYCRA